MAEYEIKFNRYNGWSQDNGNIPVESAFVELSDEEVQILVDLMSQEETDDVLELNLEELYPDIFDKLSEACDSIANDIALAEAIREAHYYDEEDTFLDKLQDHCEMEYDYDESLGDFRRWLDELIKLWSYDKLMSFYEDAGVDIWEIISYDGIEPYEYDVTIPQFIVAQVFE